ncbi:hypothetical protein JKY79_02345 [Candidatus Babeliales bacterium]|nr:hypothetical protein [Candidatus Babeliales bacterium]
MKKLLLFILMSSAGFLHAATDFQQDLDAYVDCIINRKYTEAMGIFKRYEADADHKQQLLEVQISIGIKIGENLIKATPLWYVATKTDLQLSEVFFLIHLVQQGADVTQRNPLSKAHNILHKLATKRVEMSTLIPLINEKDASLINERTLDGFTPLEMLFNTSIFKLNSGDKDYLCDEENSLKNVQAFLKEGAQLKKKNMPSLVT